MKMNKWTLAALGALVGGGLSAATTEIELNDWMLQDGAVITAQGIRENWCAFNSAKEPWEGERLSKPGFKTDGWYKATVPGTILTTLVNCGVYPEPTYGENNRPEVIPDDLCRRDWWYRTTVKVPADFKDRLVWLEFDGINYRAEIWVNGRRAGMMKGAFKRGRFNVTKDYGVKPGEDTTIAVRIIPQPTVGTPSEHIMGATGGPCGGEPRLDGPTFACAVGWDWMSGVRDRNSGIWRKVRLRATGPAILLDSYIETDLPKLPSLDTATVLAEIPVRNATDKPVAGRLTMAFDDVKLVRDVKLAPWQTETVSFDPAAEPALTVRNPKLWWPVDLGEPNLHTMDFTLEVDGVVSATRTERFGIRKFNYFEPGSDKLKLSVNGVRVFMRGGNWGTDEMLKRIDRARLEAQVRYHRDAHLNMIRNWGGQSPSDELISLCDEYGVLFWDEFWQFNNTGPVDQDFYFTNVRDHVLHFRNHASLVIWCSRNEATPPKYLDDEMRYLLLELDPKRHYQSNSGGGNGFNSGGPYDWVPPVRHSRYWEDEGVPRHETFKTEIGSFVIPTIESMQYMLPEKDWAGYTDAWAEHNFCAGGGRKIPHFMKSRYGEPANFADFVRKGQLMTYEVHKAMYEGRFGRLFDPAEGALLWMTVPAQPSLVWNMISYELDPHGAFFAIQDACASRHAFVTETDGGTLHVVNHEPNELSGDVRLVVRNLDGTVVLEKTCPVSVKGPSSRRIAKIDWPANLSPVHFVELELRDGQGRKIDDNFYWRHASVATLAAKDVRDDFKIVHMEDFTALNGLPSVTLDAKAKVSVSGDRTRIAVAVANPSEKTVALLAHLQLRTASGKRVLPAFYSDNYLSLPPKARKAVVIECATAQLKGEAPVVLVDGWNVKVSDGEIVRCNRNADPKDARWAGQKGFGLVQKPLVRKDVVRVNCGGYNRGGFAADPGFVEGGVGFQTEDMDLSTCRNAGPGDIYRTCRWGNSTYSNLLAKANAPYTVRLHWAEHSRDKGPGKNKMDVRANGKVIAGDIDPAAIAGGVWKAGTLDIPHVMTDAEGRLTLEFQNGKRLADEKRDARINAYEILPE